LTYVFKKLRDEVPIEVESILLSTLPPLTDGSTTASIFPILSDFARSAQAKRIQWISQQREFSRLMTELPPPMPPGSPETFSRATKSLLLRLSEEREMCATDADLTRIVPDQVKMLRNRS
jgi:hypothetical protein